MLTFSIVARVIPKTNCLGRMTIHPKFILSGTPNFVKYTKIASYSMCLSTKRIVLSKGAKLGVIGVEDESTFCNFEGVDIRGLASISCGWLNSTYQIDYPRLIPSHRFAICSFHTGSPLQCKDNRDYQDYEKRNANILIAVIVLVFIAVSAQHMSIDFEEYDRVT